MERELKSGALTTLRDRLPSSSQYELLLRIAAGGMATVYVGRRSGALGFSRLVAIKRAHAHLLEDPSFSDVLVGEAKIASRIHHPNVVAVQAIEILEGELLLVMDYVEGASLSELLTMSRATGVPEGIAVRILLDACAGLHAAHTSTDDFGKPLGLVHRDVSPQNILVGIDGIARVSDFGVAKSTSEGTHGTATGTLKGKVAYMAPEYVASGAFDAKSDVFALGIVAWEALTGRRLFRGQGEVETLKLVLATRVEAPSSVRPSLGPELDEPIMRALAREPSDRWPSALAFAEALEHAARKCNQIASSSQVAALMRALAGPALDRRRELLREGMAEPRSESSLRVVGRSESTGSMDVDVAPMTDAVEMSFDDRPESRVVEPPPQEPASSTLARGITAEVVEEAKSTRKSRSAIAAGIVLTGATLVLAFGATSRTSQRVAPATAATASAAPTAPVQSVSAPAAPTSPPPETTVSEAPAPTAASSAFSSPAARPPVKTRVRRTSPKPDRAPPNPYGTSE